MRLSELKLDELKFSDVRWLKNFSPNNYSKDIDDFMLPYKIENYMKKHGYVKRGRHSANSWVYTSDDSKVIVKITFDPDPAWVSFANFCSQNRNNPHLPKIARKLVKFNGDYFIAFCEKLNEIVAAPPEELYYLALLMSKYGKTMFQALQIKYWQEIIDKNKEKYESENELVLMRKWLKQNPQLIPTLKLVQANKGKWHMDLHPYNFMYRLSNNKFVIIDPYIKL